LGGGLGWLGWLSGGGKVVMVVEMVCYGGGDSLLWMRKLVRREGKLREKIIRNFVIFVEFVKND
jgi:hypothetical protein